MVFFIQNLFSKLREIEYQIYQQNIFPKFSTANKYSYNASSFEQVK